MHFYAYHARCVRVIDGDTVELDVDLGFEIRFLQRFRIVGIDTPEIFGVRKDSSEYAAGMAAKLRVEELILGKDLEVETERDRTDKYGRYLGRIVVAGVDVGQTLIAEGLATVYGS